jgi:hypothetical protein
MKRKTVLVAIDGTSRTKKLVAYSSRRAKESENSPVVIPT